MNNNHTTTINHMLSSHIITENNTILWQCFSASTYVIEEKKWNIRTYVALIGLYTTSIVIAIDIVSFPFIVIFSMTKDLLNLHFIGAVF